MDFSKKDDVFTIQLPGSDLVFTQYLYIKEEVRIALLVSILNKSEDSIFWAFELYYSGFKNELFNLLWKIYYDFFATLNPAYEVYLYKKHKEYLSASSNTNERLISSIIQDLLFRPFNSDVFMLRNISECFELDIIYHHGTDIITNTDELRHNMTQWIKNNDFRSITQWIMNLNKTFSLSIIYEICIDIFEKDLKLQKTKLLKDFMLVLKLNINHNTVLLSKIMMFFSKKADLKKGKSIYINVESEDIVPYEPIIGTHELKNYIILEKAYICGIDDFKHLSLFKLTRTKYNLKEEYWYNWEYHASFSPIWLSRIKQFGGYVDYNQKTVVFKEEPDDDLMQEFYYKFGLEPDEQKLSIQNKSIGQIEKINNWKWFNDQYKKNGIFDVFKEELDEFDISGLKY